MPQQENFDSPNSDRSTKQDSPQISSTTGVNGESETPLPISVKTNPDDDRNMDFDELLPYVGEFGLYQKIIFTMMIPFGFFLAWVYFAQIFITLVPEGHWCRIPELENFTVEQRLALAIPRASERNSATNLGYSKCSMYDVNYTEILQNGTIRVADPSWPVRKCNHGWEYNFTDVPYETISTELNWVCDDGALPSFAQSIFFVGAIFGGIIFGCMADRYGRVPALVCSNLTGFVAGVATAFTTSFWQFALCRFILGFAFDNCFVMMYILVLEYVGPKSRTLVAGISTGVFYTFATSTLPWVAYYIADWRWTCIATSGPLIIAIATPWFVPESARWLVTRGKVDKAIGILKKIERSNGTKVPDAVYSEYKKSCDRIRKAEEAVTTNSVIDLFRSPRLRNTTLLLIVIWMTVALVFDGHMRNIGNFGLNIFVTFTIAAATELPADAFLIIFSDRWGRRWLACGSMILSGIFSIWASAVSDNIYSACLAIGGIFCAILSFDLGLLYAAEILPTVVRAQGVALVHIMGFVSSMAAPFVAYLAVVSPVLPLIVLGILSSIGGGLALFLPETLNKDLPETLQDGEEFGKDQGIWDMPCLMKKVDDDEMQRGTISRFQRHGSARVSMPLSIRSEILRSTMIQRSSLRSRRNAVASIGVVKL